MTYCIYRLKDTEENTLSRFMSSEHLKKHEAWPPRPDAYEQIWDGSHHGPDHAQILEWVYAKFNIDKPMLFHHYSLSVGDIVVLIDKDKPRAFFCDSFCWTEIPGFCEEVNAA